MATSKIIIEPFNGDQKIAAAVAALHLKIRLKQREDGESDFHGNIRSSQADLKGMGAFYVQPGGNFFIAYDLKTDKIAGFIGLKKTGEDEGQIKRMAVLPAYRRQGIGTLLAQTAVAWAREAGFIKLRVATGKKEKAIFIYKSVGFTVVGYDSKRNDNLLSMDLA